MSGWQLGKSSCSGNSIFSFHVNKKYNKNIQLLSRTMCVLNIMLVRQCNLADKNKIMRKKYKPQARIEPGSPGWQIRVLTTTLRILRP